ncbi:MAG: hypothetical protein GZ089_14710 [Aromatoleum sp.]|nr:hypothetical protein [Aromatoleum sp.]
MTALAGAALRRNDCYSRAKDWDDDPAKATRAGFRMVRFTTACEMQKAVDGRLRRFHAFLMLAA